MSVLDLIIIGILAVSIVIGLIRGAVREILSIIGLALAIFLAFTFAEKIGSDYVSKLFADSPSISYSVAFALIIVITLLAVGLVNLLISQLLKVSGLSFANRIMGLVFGFVRGSGLSLVLVLILGLIPGVKEKKWWTSSKSVPIFNEGIEIIKPFIPEDVLNKLNKKSITDTIKEKAGKILSGDTSVNSATKDIINSASQTVKENINKGTQQIINSASETVNGLELEPFDGNKDSESAVLVPLEPIN